MKIVLGVHHFPPRFLGGAEGQALAYASGLRQRGHDVRVVCVESIDRGPADGVEWTDEEYQGEPVRRLSFDLGRAADPFRWEYDNPWVGRHLGELFDDIRPDLFLLVSGYLLTGSALIAARERGLPAIVRLADFWFLCRRLHLLRSDGTLSGVPPDPYRCARCIGEEQRRYLLPARVAPAVMRAFWRLRRSRARRFRERQQFLLGALNGAAAIICASQNACAMYERVGVDPRRIHYVRKGARGPDESGEPYAPGRGLRLAYLGKLAPLKGVEVLVGAVRRVRAEGLTLRLYGDAAGNAAYEGRLRTLASADPRILFCGRYQEHGGLTRVLNRIDAVVVPSVTYEAAPNVVLEAQAHGMPVIASDLGSIPELVRHDESGLLFRAGDPASLAAQIVRLVEEPSLLAVLRSGVPPVKSIEEMMDEVEWWCRRVVEGDAPAAEDRR